MKITRRIIGLCLAMISLFSVLSVSAFAESVTRRPQSVAVNTIERNQKCYEVDFTTAQKPKSYSICALVKSGMSLSEAVSYVTKVQTAPVVVVKNTGYMAIRVKGWDNSGKHNDLIWPGQSRTYKYSYGESHCLLIKVDRQGGINGLLHGEDNFKKWASFSVSPSRGLFEQNSWIAVETTLSRFNNT